MRLFDAADPSKKRQILEKLIRKITISSGYVIDRYFHFSAKDMLA